MQQTIVGLIVFLALWRVVARYAPLAVRNAMHRFLLGLLRRIGLQRLAARLASRKQAKGGACGGCNACASADGGSAPPAEPIAEFSITPEALKRTARR
ncbi:MAG: DUF6587 family protein [Janthinobacterium lividum]